MGGSPDRGEDQEVTISIAGPEKTATTEEMDTFKAQFEKFKADVKKLREAFKAGKVTVTKITYVKKDAKDSFE